MNGDLLPSILETTVSLHLEPHSVILDSTRPNRETWELIASRGIDDAFMGRIVRGEPVEVWREVLIMISIAMVLDRSHVDKVVEMANRLLDAGGYRVLRGH